MEGPYLCATSSPASPASASRSTLSSSDLWSRVGSRFTAKHRQVTGTSPETTLSTVWSLLASGPRTPGSLFLFRRPLHRLLASFILPGFLNPPSSRLHPGPLPILPWSHPSPRGQCPPAVAPPSPPALAAEVEPSGEWERAHSSSASRLFSPSFAAARDSKTLTVEWASPSS